MTQDLALYIHWPFCTSKCPYCDFNSHVAEKIDQEKWRRAYRREMEYIRSLTGPRRIASVFFGGGTPSLMEPKTVECVINFINDFWGLFDNTEVTLEANPTSVEAEKLRDFKRAGVGRVSLGVQALNDPDLKNLGRRHSAAEAQAALKTAAGIFDRYTFDLIYARPGQSVAAWRAELKDALALAGGHMSLYQLTIEPGTPYHALHQRGELKTPGEETAAALYETTQEIMEARGLPAYEISNHAAKGQESRHNLAYWRYQDYAGVGPGAHGRLTRDGKKCATRAHRAPAVWLERVAAHGHGFHPFEDISPDQRVAEMLMMGLRLAEGVALAAFEKETGRALASCIAPGKISALETEDLLRLTETSLVAMPAGRQKLDAVLKFLMS